ncbi:hypothetical protein H310_13905 [Aphanomyces invadans]|uniref:Carrier domain-containing protein n=1 Tax=Aphanomyces invadans TaxID=157072 RepID=A0A024TBZ0_9STRA|nr:hypothetical protein H310_13905 [Aphanomyces invadans]ETV91509.1 hypothetical protein H310_13905 [Aphanomyces invadans]|eukprot:XP_008879777.1 hypothetical protein H310_13905 [Aphanomyces invadans]
MSHGIALTPNSPITIGSTIANVNCYVLDENQRQVPMGVSGEFYLGGVCVSPGYINLPELTRDRFVLDPYSRRPGTMYRTGDVGRLLPNGQFEILGRMDSQVKLKGYRIELDEVANAMMLHPDVISACVIVQDKSHLVGYFTPATVNVESLRKTVVDRLPVYMVPAMWTGLDEMPQNSNGKINTKALALLKAVVELEAMQTHEEAKLAQVIASVLEVDVAEIGRRSSFVALGGDSITAIYLAAELKKIGWRVSVGDILQSTQLCDLALTATEQAHIPAVEWSDVPLPSQVSQDITTAWPEHEAAYATTPEQSFLLSSSIENPSRWILQVPFVDLDASRLVTAYARISEHCEALRTTFILASDNTNYHVVNPASCVEVRCEHKATSLTEFLALDKARAFQATDATFARFTVVSVPHAESIGVLTIHHALYDGWSISLLLSDLMDAYHDRPIPQRPSFRPVIHYVQAQDPSKTVAFWTEKQRQLVQVTLRCSLPLPCPAYYPPFNLSE